MKRILICFLLSALLIGSSFVIGAERPSYDYTNFAMLPVLDQGRIKPLDTLARTYLKIFNGKDSLKDMSAIEWIAEVLFDSQKAYERRIFNITNQVVVDTFGLERRKRHRYSYNELSVAAMSHFKTLHALFGRPKEELTMQQEQLLTVYSKIRIFMEISQSLHIIPAQAEDKTGLWRPLLGKESGYLLQKAEFLKAWDGLATTYHAGNDTKWKEASRELLKSSLSIAGSSVSGKKLSSEVSLNNWGLFLKSLIFYLLAFLAILLGFIFWPIKMQRIAFILLLVGFHMHMIGISMRMMIMGRPPVTNLYETIIFVGFVAVLFGLILELLKKNGIGIIVAASVGTVMHFLGFRYAAESDTMGMLAAVLDTNLWLSTHVVTITLGFGCCLVGGVIAHIYLLQRIIKPSDSGRLNELDNNIRGVSFVALFFTTMGTILGGIWADQSWGRFWGWDPKENGALLVILWLIWLIHGHISKKISELGFAVGMVCTNIIVALAWFGVNLLNVGRHSYGFTKKTAMGLVLFCGVELLFALGSFAFIKFRTHQRKGSG